MNREEKIYHVFNRAHELNVKNTFYSEWLRNFIDWELAGDQVDDDLTTLALMIPITSSGKVSIIAKENGIIAGIEEVVFLYNIFKLDIKTFKKDGEHVFKGDTILEIEGSRKQLLEVERLGLNILQRMSGISTLTSSLYDKIPSHSNTKIAGTRKTLWRYLDKKAITVGGGLTHRLNLNDNILIKDNHLAMLKQIGFANPVTEALKRAWLLRKRCRGIEIELSSSKDVFGACETINDLIEYEDYPFVIMFDNLPPNKINNMIHQLKQENYYSNILFEASGNIDSSNIMEYSITGVDVLSLGMLTHSSKNFDLSQKVFIEDNY